MKIINKILLVGLLLVVMSSCEDFVGGDINQDPNKPTLVPINAQMPQIQIALADVYGGAFSRFNCMLSQQVEGVARQWLSMNQYTGLTPNRFDAAWTNVYENILNEIKFAKNVSTENGYNHYLGILKTMEAFILMAGTDVWDNMPYSDALKGVESTNPSYDTQESIYNVVNSSLNEAITLLNGAPGPVAPGSDDVYYGGVASTWALAANALKARAALKANDYSGAMAAAKASFGSADDNLAFQYPDANAATGWFRFNRDRTADIEFHPHLGGLLTSFNDTLRLNLWNPLFTTEHPYMVPDFLMELATYREMQFIIAECDFRLNGGTAEGHTAFRNGIAAAYARCGFTEDQSTAYMAQSIVDPGVGNLTLEQIMTQKYIAMYLQPETYSDVRRTNIPELTPVSGNAVPVRWHYGSNEYLFNSNSPSEADVNIFQDKVGWNR